LFIGILDLVGLSAFEILGLRKNKRSK
jgi:hypothetical protein